MKAYQKYVKEHQNEIHESISNIVRILERPEQYQEYDTLGTYVSDKLKSISKSEYATLCCAERTLDIMSRHDIEITLEIAFELSNATRYAALYTPANQLSIELRTNLINVSKILSDKTYQEHMKELYPTVFGKEKG